jgi:hypothetical protein
MLEHWYQDINKCWNIGPKGYKLASEIWWYPFFSLGADTRPERSAIISTWGRLNFEKKFSLDS